jgi:hypothetical protein
MTKMQQLKKEALKSCKWRGHTMNRFKMHDFFNQTIAYSNCKNCDCQVVVNIAPMPNQIDIGGEAVALNCNK